MSREEEEKLTHRLGEAVDDLFGVRGELALGGEFLREALGLFDSRDVAGEEEPKHSFGDWKHSSDIIRLGCLDKKN
jgi:hypothetical protein